MLFFLGKTEGGVVLSMIYLTSFILIWQIIIINNSLQQRKHRGTQQSVKQAISEDNRGKCNIISRFTVQSRVFGQVVFYNSCHVLTSLCLWSQRNIISILTSTPVWKQRNVSKFWGTRKYLFCRAEKHLCKWLKNTCFCVKVLPGQHLSSPSRLRDSR